MGKDFYDALQAINEEVGKNALTKTSSDALLSLLYSEAENIIFFDDNGVTKSDEHITGIDFEPSADEHAAKVRYQTSKSLRLYMEDYAERNLRHVFVRGRDGGAYFLNMNENGILTGCTEKPAANAAGFMDTYGPKTLRGFETLKEPGFFAKLAHSIRNSWLMTKIFGKPTEPDEVDLYNQAKTKRNNFLNAIGFDARKEAEAAKRITEEIEAAKKLEEEVKAAKDPVKEVETTKESVKNAPVGKEAEEAVEEPWFPGQSLDDSVIYTDGTYVDTYEGSTEQKLDTLLNACTAVQEKISKADFEANGLDVYKFLAMHVLRNQLSETARYGDPEKNPQVQFYLDALDDVEVKHQEEFMQTFEKQAHQAAKNLRSDKALRNIIESTSPEDQKTMLGYLENAEGGTILREIMTRYSDAMKKAKENEQPVNEGSLQNDAAVVGDDQANTAKDAVIRSDF